MKKIFSILLLGYSTQIISAERNITCGIAKGYPPFQYEESGVAKGIDADSITKFNKYNEGKIKISIQSLKWDDAIAFLHFTQKIDCIWGMEITDSRKKRFHFSKPIYNRYSSLFVLKESEIQNSSDLVGKTITGDSDSKLNDTLSQNSKIRIISVDTKDEAFLKLKNKRVQASIIPKKVGEYLSEKYKVELRSILEDKEGVPVAIASKRSEIRDLIDEGLERVPGITPQK